MKRLFRVKAVAMIMADSPAQAVAVALQNLKPLDCTAREVVSTPSEWYDAIPYGADEDATVGDILKREREEGV